MIISSGKLRLIKIKSQSSVKEGDVIAYLENATSFDTLERIKSILKNYNSNQEDNISLLKLLPSKVALGEITSKYYTFLENLHQLKNFKEDKLYEKQIAGLNDLLYEQKKRYYQ